MYTHTIEILDEAIEAWTISIELDSEPPHEEARALGREVKLRSATIAKLPAHILFGHSGAVARSHEALVSLLHAMLSDAVKARATKEVRGHMQAVRAILASIPRSSAGRPTTRH